jgi:hypothetical protein
MFTLHGSVTVSAYTRVEADTIEEALEIARERSEFVEMEFNGSRTDPEKTWLVDSIDGEVVDIHYD